MLIKGTENVKWTEDADPNKPMPPGELHWFEKVDWHTLEIPFAKRIKGGTQYSFKGYDFTYMIAEIKEQSGNRFKTNIDVNRHAHYLGMNIIHQMWVKNKKSGLAEKLAKKLKAPQRMLYDQEMLSDFFKEFYESYVNGMMTREELLDRAVDISEEVIDEKLKEWFLNHCSKMADDKDILRKTKDNIRHRRAYHSNLRLVEEGG
jgi:hypothetical protein